MKPERPTPSPHYSAAVLRVDLDWRIEAANALAEKITGMAENELVGKSAGVVFSGCKDSPDLTSCANLVRKGMVVTDIALFVGDHRGPKSRPLLATVLPLPGPGHTFTGALICLKDSTDVTSSQQMPLNSRDAGVFATDHNNTSALPPQRILDSIADGVFTVDRDWVITSFNGAAEAITGWPATQAVGRRCSEVFCASICGKSCAIAESLYSGRSVANRSITIQGRAGEKIPISISASPLIDHEGNIIGGVETFRDLSALTNLRPHLSQKYSFDQIFSKSKTMQRLFAIMPEVAASPSTVLIYGESGTGKELITRALYNISDRNNMPFVALNCGAIPESLLESELFGYKAGAFTDARKDKEGRFAAAEGGILFLDEIGDIPQSIQVKLLRVLQEKVYEPLGSNSPVKTDVRIITATNRDLKTLVHEGKFREDLYYRLNVVRINLPPLRDRKEDIPLLIDQFILEFSALQAKDIVGIATSALNILMRHDFPGNIRELKNIIEYAFILCDGGYIQPQHLPDPFGTVHHFPELEMNAGVERPQTLDEIEKQAIYLALENNKWKKALTCDELGISKDTLRRKLSKYNLEQPFTGTPLDQD